MTQPKARHSFRRTLNPANEIPQNEFGQTVLGETDKRELSEKDFVFSVHPQYGVQAEISSLTMAPRVLKNMLEALKDEPDDNPQKQAILAQLREIEDCESGSEEPSELTQVLDAPPTNEFLDRIMAIEEDDSVDTESDMIDVDSIPIPAPPSMVRTKFITVNPDELDIVYRQIPPVAWNIAKTASAQKAPVSVPIESAGIVCIKCRFMLPNATKFCPECGASQVIKHCVECGYKFINQEKFCPDCGTAR